jgi:hypothetical protein
MYALAPDEAGYIYTFNNVYTLPIGTSAQTGSGWITAPTVFLWIAYLPAKILNLLGVPDYLSVRSVSVLITAITLYLLLDILKTSKFFLRFHRGVVFTIFFIPSIFLWTSVGLRESFIIAELTLFLAGLNFLMREMNKRCLACLFLGSYGLASTKNYLWACLMIALIVSCVIYLFIGIQRQLVLKLIALGLLLPLLAFAGTTSKYALDYIFNSNISETGERSGDSISQVYVEVPQSGAGTETGTGAGTETGTGTGTGTELNPPKELITFHGDSTLISLYFYIIENPNSLFTKIFKMLNLDKKVETIWNEKVALGLVSKDKKVGKDTSSLNGHILEPGKIDKPLSLIWPAFVFLCGPFPFIGNPGIAVLISSFESPLWWAFYSLVLFQFFRFRKTKFLRDPQILFTLVFLLGEIVFSALVEVNLGTSFRHRSIILAPLVFLYVRLAQRASEQKEKELGII